MVSPSSRTMVAPWGGLETLCLPISSWEVLSCCGFTHKRSCMSSAKPSISIFQLHSTISWRVFSWLTKQISLFNYFDMLLLLPMLTIAWTSLSESVLYESNAHCACSKASLIFSITCNSIHLLYFLTALSKLKIASNLSLCRVQCRFGLCDWLAGWLLLSSLEVLQERFAHIPSSEASWRASPPSRFLSTL